MSSGAACGCASTASRTPPFFSAASLRGAPMNVLTDIVADPVITADPWFKDAVIYQLHVKAFQDSTDDGIGDFNGLTSRLDYLQDLGIDTLWLLPFYPSPGRDDGYDIA